MSRYAPAAAGRVASIIVIALATGLRTVAAQAVTSRNHLYDTWQLVASGSTVRLGSTLRVDGAQGEGTEVDVEDLGLEQSTLEPRLAVRWRPGRRHELELGYQFARRGGEKTLTGDIAFGDSIYHAGLRVNPTLNSDQAFLIYRFAFTAKEKTQIGAAVSIAPYFLAVGLDAMGSLSDGSEGDAVEFSQRKTLIGPTGSVGLFGHFRIASRWDVGADARYIRISISQLTAAVVAVGLAARYFLSDRLGIEAGYGLDGVKVDVTEVIGRDAEEFVGRISFLQQNLRLGVVLAP